MRGIVGPRDLLALGTGRLDALESRPAVGAQCCFDGLDSARVLGVSAGQMLERGGMGVVEGHAGTVVRSLCPMELPANPKRHRWSWSARAPRACMPRCAPPGLERRSSWF